jgi:uncharacterized membrane protein YfcA
MHSVEIFSTVWVIALCAVLFASFIRGLTGFGFALILAPLLLLVMSPAAVVVVNILLGMFSNIVVLVYFFRRIDVKRILPMALSALLGIPVGVWIISAISPSILKVFIGAVIICFAILLALGLRKTFAGERLSSGIAGFFSGVFITSTSIGGPPVVLFMHSQRWPKEVIHPSLAGYFTFVSGFSLGALALAGHVNTEIVVTAASLAPVMLAGTGLGIVVFNRVNARLFRAISLGIVICAGILGIISGLGLFP